MNGHDTLPKSPRGNSQLTLRLAVWATAALLATGCEEHRMSLSEFMALHEGQVIEVTETQPSTQPSLTEEERAMVDRELGPYRVGPGDELSVDISVPEGEAARAAVQVRVDKNGEIRLPKAGAIQVGGLELEEVENRILDTLIEREVYVERNQIAVHVTIVAPETTTVLVVGAATSPGLVRLRRTERNLLSAVAAASGISQSASGDITLRRLRRPEESITLNLQDPEQLKNSLALAPLDNGDIVEVHAAVPNTVFVGGLVNTPGPQPYPPGTTVTVLQAIAAASGLRTDLTPREATLIRRVGGRDYHVKLDLDRMTVAKEPNITLAAGDVLWVPYTVETRIQDWINKNIFIRVGANATYGLNYNMSGEDYLNSAARQRARINQGGGGSSLQDSFDPFGFIQRNNSLNSLQNTVR